MLHYSFKKLLKKFDEIDLINVSKQNKRNGCVCVVCAALTVRSSVRPEPMRIAVGDHVFLF